MKYVPGNVNENSDYDKLNVMWTGLFLNCTKTPHLRCRWFL